MEKRGSIILFGSDAEAAAFGTVCDVDQIAEVRASYLYVKGLSRLPETVLVVDPSVVARLKLSIDTYNARDGQ